jgi:flagellar FliL protein
MSDGSEESVAAESEEEPRRRLGRKLVLFAAVAVLSSGALAGGLFLSLGAEGRAQLLAGDSDGGAARGAPADTESAKLTDRPGYAMANFDDMIVNITAVTATGRVTSRFLKLKVALVYDQTAEGAENVAGRELFMRDAFQDYLRQLSERDLQGSIGIVNLKAELLRRARAIAESRAPSEVLIADMVIQ